MSIFKQPPNERPSERPLTRPEPPVAESAPSVIGAGMKIVGDVETNGVIKIEGTVEGAIRGARQVVLGRSGVIQGDVQADEAVLGGRVVGMVLATDRVEIQSTCRIEGDIHTKSIVVIEGGVINGSVRMDDGAGRGSVALTAATARSTVAPPSPT